MKLYASPAGQPAEEPPRYRSATKSCALIPTGFLSPQKANGGSWKLNVAVRVTGLRHISQGSQARVEAIFATVWRTLSPFPYSAVWPGDGWSGSQAAVRAGGAPVLRHAAAPRAPLLGCPMGRTLGAEQHHSVSAGLWEDVVSESDTKQKFSLGRLRGGGEAQGPERSAEPPVREAALLLLRLRHKPHKFSGICEHLRRTGKSIFFFLFRTVLMLLSLYQAAERQTSTFVALSGQVWISAARPGEN